LVDLKKKKTERIEKKKKHCCRRVPSEPHRRRKPCIARAGGQSVPKKRRLHLTDFGKKLGVEEDENSTGCRQETRKGAAENPEQETSGRWCLLTRTQSTGLPIRRPNERQDGLKSEVHHSKTTGSENHNGRGLPQRGGDRAKNPGNKKACG